MVMVSGGAAAAIARVNAWLAVAPLASFTCTVKPKLFAEDGVPARVPDAFSESPGGTDPPVTANEYGGVPPEAEIACEYEAPTVPPGSVAPVVIVSGGPAAAATASVNALLPDVPFVSTACTVNVKLPAVVGVPLRDPLEGSNEMPPGKTPVVTDHVYGGLPPDAAKACEYDFPTWPAGNGDPVVMVTGSPLMFTVYL